MTLHYKKLIDIIDQLIVWHRENNGAEIPSTEHDRLRKILNLLLSNNVMSEEEWETLKPKQKVVYHSDRSMKSEYDKSIRELKELVNNIYSGQLYNSAFKKGTVKPTFKKTLPSNSTSQTNNSNLNKSEWTVCNNCRARVKTKHLKRHSNKCKSTAKLTNKTKSSSPASKFYTGKSIDNYKTERKLDGSHGYHDFARENGKYGSHSKYDNMGDESMP